MKLINNAPCNYIAFDVVLEAGKVLDVKDSKVANILKTQPGVEEYVDLEEVKELKKEVARLKGEEEPKKESKKSTSKKGK